MKKKKVGKVTATKVKKILGGIVAPVAAKPRKIVKAKPLPKAQLKYFRKMLEEKKEDLVQEVEKRLQEGQQVERVEVKDPADQALDSYESELHYGINDAERKFLEEVEDALQRIQGGSFGVCMSCGSAISQKRLKAMPSARLCIGCKQAQEHARL